MRVWQPAWSLRSKLIVACVLVQAAGSALLIFGSIRLLQQTLLEQAGTEARQIGALLDQAIAAPLAQRDYATLQQTLDLIRSDEFVNYLVLSDHRGKTVAASGWDNSRPLPPRDTGEIDLDRADATLHLVVPIRVAGQPLGHVDLGLSTASLRKARADFLARSIGIGVAALLVSMLVLAAIAFAITRHLARLAHASTRVADGDFDVQVPVTSRDEIAHLGNSFNMMAAALKQRVSALQESETKQRALLHKAREEHSRLTTLLGAIDSGIVFVDAAGLVIYANAAFGRIWAMAGELSGQRLQQIVPSLVRQTTPAQTVLLEAMLNAGNPESIHSRELLTLDGRIITVRMQPVTQGSADGGYIWFHDDITLERQTQQRAHLALHDALTKLLNRRGFYEALQTAIARAAADNAQLTLLFMDLDDFKHANDVGGHRTGDEILGAVARTLAEQMRKGEIVARLGGDEFGVLCPGMGPGDAAIVADRLIQAVARLNFSASGQSLHVGCSVGIATYPIDAKNEDDLVACADAAMYEAKQSGKNGWSAYRHDPARVQTELARVDWNAKIQRALQDQRFVLHFQPVHWAQDLRVAHHEALLRMVDESDPRQLISPARFLPHAERSGMIRQIDRWVFGTCIAQLAQSGSPMSIAANLSARSLEDASFPDMLRDALQRHDVDPRRLHIELTETPAVSDVSQARRMIDALRALGCAVHLDDFGSGFSSFARLKLLGVDAIKIDGAFIRNLYADASNRLFVASIIEIAHSLGKIVVAEHVEDAATLDILRTLKIDLVQGFHLARPSANFSDARPRGKMQVVSDIRPVKGGDAG
jgi:diguanylate cyclase (GGDEF)-like protein